jgi:hypothetical protein
MQYDGQAFEPPEPPPPVELPEPPPAASTYTLRVEIEHSEPPIWRRLAVRSDLRLDALHRLLQAAFGWQDSHLHRFALGDAYTGPSFLTAFDLEEGEEGMSEEDARLDQVLTAAGDRLTYEYDFGDGWTHLVTLESADPAKEGPATRCLDGERAGPVEDSGGIHHYEAIAAWHRAGRPRDTESVDAELVESWLPDGFDPDAFAVKDVDARVRRVRYGRNR